MTDTTQPPAETLGGAREAAALEPNEAEALAARLDASIAFKVYSSSDDYIRDAAAMLRRLAALTRRAGGDAMERFVRTIADMVGDELDAHASIELRDRARAILAGGDAIPAGEVERPFAHCCAEAGGRVEACDCVNKNHGTAWFATPKPPAGGDAGAVDFAALIEPWKDHHGPLPDYDSPIACVFDAGVQYAVELLAKELGVTEWTPCDGTEEYDGDLGGTLMNIVREAMPLDRDGERMWPSEVCAALALPAPAVEGERFTGEQAWDELVNVDDRTSPEEYPDMCLITRDELIDFMNRAALSEGRSHG